MSDEHNEVLVVKALPQSRERRRPGRIANASRYLIPLFRGEIQTPCDDEIFQEHDLAAASGLAMSTLLSELVWLTIAFIL